jgi:hypothetical protein
MSFGFYVGDEAVVGSLERPEVSEGWVSSSNFIAADDNNSRPRPHEGFKLNAIDTISQHWSNPFRTASLLTCGAPHWKKVRQTKPGAAEHSLRYVLYLLACCDGPRLGSSRSRPNERLNCPSNVLRAVWLREQDGTSRQIEFSDRHAARGRNDTDWRPTVFNCMGQLRAVHTSGHVNVRKDYSDIRAALKNAYGSVCIGSLDHFKTSTPNGLRRCRAN